MIEEKDGMRYVPYETAKTVIEMVISLLEKQDNDLDGTTNSDRMMKILVLRDVLFTFRPEMLTTLVAAMYAGRDMANGVPEDRVSANPDEEILAWYEALGYDGQGGDEKWYAIMADPIVSKNWLCVKEYFEAFFARYEQNEAA